MMGSVTKIAAAVSTAVLMTVLMPPAMGREPTHASWTEWGRVHDRETYPNDWDTQRHVEQDIFDGYTGYLIRRWDSADARYRLKWYDVWLGDVLGWDCGSIQYVNVDGNDNGWVAQWKTADVGTCW
jgi:hypothetical protein